MSWSNFLRAGLSMRYLQKVCTKVCMANKHVINIMGVFWASFSGVSPDGRTITCEDIVYVSDSVCEFYLSKTTMRELKIIE